VARAVAESNAPTSGCGLTISHAADAAAIYAGQPPSKWRRAERQAYVASIENAGIVTWGSDGSATELAVSFVGLGAPHLAPAMFRLPQSVPPMARIDVRIEIAGPPDSGTYLLEHRVVLKGSMPSEQALRVFVGVQ
jgi:hypothetical protein